MTTLIDLSHEVEDGMITYPGLPGPVVCDYLSREASKANYAEGTSFHIGRIDMIANTGTYIDSPFHRYADGKDLAELPLESIADLKGVVVNATKQSAIDAAVFREHDVSGKAVLVHTGWARHWAIPEYLAGGHPYLTQDAAQYLLDNGAALVGIDSLNIDSTGTGERPVHSLLLGAEIPIVEHLCNLEQLTRSDFRFHAVPVKIKSFGTFPVRAYAVAQQ